MVICLSYFGLLSHIIYPSLYRSAHLYILNTMALPNILILRLTCKYFRNLSFVEFLMVFWGIYR